MASDGERGLYWPLLAVMALFAACWLLVNPFGDYPLNDDWAYAFAARSIAEGHGFRLTGFTAPNLIAQAYWGALFCLPFGFSHDALRISTLVASLGGLWAAFGVMRELGASRLVSLLAVAGLGCTPLYLVLSAGFMTDVPFTTLCSLSFWLYLRGVRVGSGALQTSAFAVAVVALMIRQFAIFLPVGFGAALLLRRGLRVGPAAAAAAPVLLFAALNFAFQRWILETGRAPRFAEAIDTLATVSLSAQAMHVREFVVASLPYFGLMTLPFLVPCLLGWRRRREWWFWVATAATGAAICLVVALEGRLLPSLGNVIARYGIGPLTLRETFFNRKNLPEWPNVRLFWIPLTVVSAFATSAIVVMACVRLPQLWRSLRQGGATPPVWQAGMFVGFIGGYLVSLFLALLLDNLFDRYFIPLVIPLSALLFLWFAPDPTTIRRVLALCVAPAAIALVLAVLTTHDYLAFNGARWAATSRLQREGIADTDIDGGFEFNGSTKFNGLNPSSLWGFNKETYLIALGPVPDYTLVSTTDFPHWFWPSGFKVRTLKRIGASGP